jgi:hypothetical protein
MVDLKDLTPQALKAAMQSGVDGWGSFGSADQHVRYSEPLSNFIKDKRRLRKCHCGCNGKSTHLGMANGVGLAEGCQFFVYKWVRNLKKEVS